MPADLVFPKNNEPELIQMAEYLGFSDLYLIYQYQKNISQYKQKIHALQQNTKINLSLGLIANQQDIQKAKNICNFVITPSSNNNQYIFEKQKPNLIYDLETLPQKDSLHFRHSGLNQVLCSLAKQNNITSGISFNTVLHSKNKAVLLGRTMQNIMLCRKYKVKMRIASFASLPYEMRSASDLASLGIVLGMHPREAKQSLAQT